jgi:Domain of unknown function (DUF1843)
MSSKKSTAKAKSAKASDPIGGPLPPYGVPIKAAIAGGNLREMKAMATQTRKHIAEVERALKGLEREIEKRNKG